MRSFPVIFIFASYFLVYCLCTVDVIYYMQLHLHSKNIKALMLYSWFLVLHFQFLKKNALYNVDLIAHTVHQHSKNVHFTGPPSAPTDLNITSYNDSTTLLVWGPPPDAQSPPLLSYAVVIRNGIGAPVYSETVREPQLVITTPDPCGHYEATVTPMCGSITGAQTSPVELESKFKETALYCFGNDVSLYNVPANSP